MNNRELNKSKQAETASYQPKKDSSTKWMIFVVLGFFIGFGLSIGFYGVTLISLLDFSKFIAAFAVIGFLIPLKVYQKKLHFIKYEVVIFNLLGIAPFLAGLFLTLNFFISTPISSEIYFIEKVYLGSVQNNLPPKIILENNLYEDEGKITEITSEEAPLLLSKNHLKLTISKGLFGFKVIKEREFIHLD